MRRLFLSCLSLVALSACAEKFDAQKSSMVIATGPYRIPHEQHANLIAALRGDEKSKGAMLMETFMHFEKDDGSDDVLFSFVVAHMNDLKPDTYYRYTEVASPGTYNLKRLQIGYMKLDYDAKHCGNISFTLNPNELLYIGGIKPDERADINKGYTHYIPRFTPDEQLTRQQVIDSLDKVQKADAQNKTVAVRMPQHQPLSNMPESCFKQSKPIWERL